MNAAFFNKHWKDAARPHCSSSSSVQSLSINLVPTGASYSTLMLLEQVHLLTQYVHDDNGLGSNDIIDFFVRILGFGLDPKSVGNLKKGSGMTLNEMQTCLISQKI